MRIFDLAEFNRPNRNAVAFGAHYRGAVSRYHYEDEQEGEYFPEPGEERIGDDWEAGADYEIVGNNPDIAGVGMEDIVGYLPIGYGGYPVGAMVHVHPSRGGGRPMPRPGIRPIPYAPPNSPLPGLPLKALRPTRDREWTIGFDSVTTIAAGATSSVIKQPQQVFRPERVTIPDAVADSWLVNDIKVGNVSQFLADGAVPGANFSTKAFGVRMRMDTAQISQQLIINVTNVSGGALRFNAAMTGVAVA